MCRNLYTSGMSNLLNMPTPDPTRQARAEFVKTAIESDDRSIRYVAARIGTSNSALADRVKGRVAFLADDIESIAYVLKRDPVAFFRDYLAASTKNTPTPQGEGRDVPPGRVELPAYSLQGKKSNVTYLPLAA